MAFRGLKLTWVCIASLFISCSIILSFKFKNTFPFVSTFRQTDFIKTKRRKHFVEQGIDYHIAQARAVKFHNFGMSVVNIVCHEHECNILFIAVELLNKINIQINYSMFTN